MYLLIYLFIICSCFYLCFIYLFINYYCCRWHQYCVNSTPPLPLNGRVTLSLKEKQQLKRLSYSSSLAVPLLSLLLPLPFLLLLLLILSLLLSPSLTLLKWLLSLFLLPLPSLLHSLFHLHFLFLLVLFLLHQLSLKRQEIHLIPNHTKRIKIRIRRKTRIRRKIGIERKKINWNCTCGRILGEV